jgi:hypothetical protein
MTLNTIQTSVEDLGTAVKEFKEDYTQRLQRLEERVCIVIECIKIS